MIGLGERVKIKDSEQTGSVVMIIDEKSDNPIYCVHDVEFMRNCREDGLERVCV
tara:strand:- start:1291 stop:1452 length:162 start_codon:yes stop_codon:yes gene_type:complete